MQESQLRAEQLHLTGEVLGAISSQARVTAVPHSIYRYPARFSPEFARAAISAFTKPGDVVIDPFCGGGTSVVEALSLGRRAVGSDISALAAFLSRTKTTPLSPQDQVIIERWAKTLAQKPPIGAFATGGGKNYYHRNLPVGARRFFAWAEQNVCLLPRQNQRDFVRMVLVGTGQALLDCKDERPGSSDLRELFENKLTTELDQFVLHWKSVLSSLAISSRELVSYRRVINRSAEALGQDARIPASWRPIKLVVTSPPYPGVHVLYHRWQIRGRRETPAPFWVAGKLDGAGASFYTMGSRHESGLPTYYSKLRRSFASLRVLLDADSVVAQLVAFSEPEWQLPLYLEAMSKAGYREAEPVGHGIPNGGDERVWRDVPGRKWYAANRGSISASREVLLLHRPHTA